MTRTDTDTAAEGATLNRFLDRLDDFDVSHALVAPDGVAAAVDAAASEPAVGVALPDGLGDLPAGVTTDWSPADLRGAATGVTPASLGVADYGSLVLPTTPAGVEPVSLFADGHVAVVAERDVVPGMADALARLGDRFRADGDSAVVATGPSATADMGALVKGAHGPKTVHAVVVRS
ncbi:LUD domain-containing protein [Halosimplex halobium]|uniref:LUD domain-containing protein n=1 Tax=Halosimplex halobium TaxID=3396618 RepID=UPI003F57A0CA